MNKLFCCLLIALPLHRLSVTSGYGFRIHPITGQYRFHDGVDLRADHDTVFAVATGSVAALNFDRIAGLYIKIRSGDLQVSYCHLSRVLVLPADTVLSGQAIGITGTSGRVTGEHLHLSMHYRGASVNPLRFLLYAMQHINKQ